MKINLLYFTWPNRIDLITETSQGWDPTIRTATSANLSSELTKDGEHKIRVMALTVPSRYAVGKEIEEQLLEYSEILRNIEGYTFTGLVPQVIDGYTIDGKYVAGLTKY